MEGGDKNAYDTVVYKDEKKSSAGKIVLIILAILAFLLTIIMLIYVMARIDEIDRVKIFFLSHVHADL